MKILLVVYDNQSFVPYFPMGNGYLGAVIRQSGHEVVIYSQDVNRSSDECLTKYLDDNRFDMVGLGMVAGYYQYRKMISLSKAINNSKNRNNFIYVVGGYMVTPEPAYFLKKLKADIAVLGEGEETIVELLNNKFSDLKNIKGIAYCESDNVVINPRRETIKNIDDIPMPAYDMFNMNFYKLMRFPGCEYNDNVASVLSGRGCIYSCNYCVRMDDGFRPRSGESILKEVEYLMSNYGVNYIIFSDELLMSSEKRTIELCEQFRDSGLNFRWACEGRLNFAKLDVLKLMKETGCKYIDYGIESFDDASLKIMKKCLTTKIIVKGIENTLQVGISPGLNVIFGNIGETKEVLYKDMEFLLKYNDFGGMRTIRPVIPYPGCSLYRYVIEKGLMKDVEDFYENKLLNLDLISVNITDMTDEEFYQNLCDVNKILIEKYFDYNKEKILQKCEMFYSTKDVSFRGFRPLL